MAESRTVDPFKIDFSAIDSGARPFYRRLSLINGVLIGLALGLGAWGVEMARVARLPVTSYLPALFLGIGVAALLGGLIGWLTGRVARTPATVALWAAAGIAFMFLMSYLPYQGNSFAVWLADSRFWGRPVFPSTLEATPGGIILGGFFIILTLVVLGLLQNYRLESLAAEMRHRGRLSGRGWLSLLLPLPVVFLVSMATHNVMSNPSAAAVEITHLAISRAQPYEGDLRELDLADGISYAALRGVQGMIDGPYTLNVVDIDPTNATVIIGAQFQSGAWVYCRIISGQLSFCYDATPSYTVGLRSLITGEALPDDCRGCALAATQSAAAWLSQRRDLLGDVTLERVAQQGSHVLMRATSPDGHSVECWIVGVTPTQLTECRETGGG
jgi:hypothetical protein